jgi:photosystem II stability/assembly factor-like uncharacterized protein
MIAMNETTCSFRPAPRLRWFIYPLAAWLSACGTSDGDAPTAIVDGSAAGSDASGGQQRDLAGPQQGDVQATSPTPPAQWVNVTGNLAGMASECGNTQILAAHPSRDMLITVVAKQGLWASTDGAASWQQLWPAAGAMQISNRGTAFVFDPMHPATFWEAGIYNGAGVYRTNDDGASFTALGNARHLDSVSVDLGDPMRLTLLAGGHEQKQTVYRSADGGNTWTNVGQNLPAGTNFCTHVLVIDQNVHLVGCSGYAGGTDGVFRTTDGGKTWASTSTQSAAASPLWASDGTIYWSLIYDRGLMKSTDQGQSWMLLPAAKVKTGRPIELPDGRIVAVGAKTLLMSADKGASFTPVGDPLPFAPGSLSYSPFRNAFYIEQADCGNAVLPNAISRFGFDYRLP